jgi:hypothetical protein
MSYSTCSLNPLEDEAVVAALLAKTDGALTIVRCVYVCVCMHVQRYIYTRTYGVVAALLAKTDGALTIVRCVCLCCVCRGIGIHARMVLLLLC